MGVSARSKIKRDFHKQLNFFIFKFDNRVNSYFIWYKHLIIVTYLVIFT